MLLTCQVTAWKRESDELRAKLEKQEWRADAPADVHLWDPGSYRVAVWHERPTWPTVCLVVPPGGFFIGKRNSGFG